MTDPFLIIGALAAVLSLILLSFVELPPRARQILGATTLAGGVLVAWRIWRLTQNTPEPPKPAEPIRPPDHEITDAQILSTDAHIDAIDDAAVDGLSSNETAAMDLLEQHDRDSNTDR